MGQLVSWKKKKKSSSPYQKAVRKLDKVFSEYIRRRDSDSYGMAKCCTCERVKHWKEADAGHYISRAKKTLRWHEQNVHLQCKYCNAFDPKQHQRYAVFIEKKYGKATLDKLEALQGIPFKKATFELEEMAEYYKNKIKEMYD